MSSTRPPWGLRVAPHLAVLSMGYVMFGYAGVPAFFIEQYDIGYAAFGLLMSATILPIVLVQWPASRLVERTTAVRALLAATLASAGIALTLDFAPSYEAMLGLRFLWGLAGGISISVGATHVARLYEGAAASRQQGLYGGMVTLGGAVGFLTAPRFVALTDGVGVHALGAVVALPAIGFLWLHQSDRLTAPTTSSNDASPFAVATNRGVLLAALCYVAIISSYITLSTVVTAYYDELGVVGPLNVMVLSGAREWYPGTPTRRTAVRGHARGVRAVRRGVQRRRERDGRGGRRTRDSRGCRQRRGTRAPCHHRGDSRPDCWLRRGLRPAWRAERCGGGCGDTSPPEVTMTVKATVARLAVVRVGEQHG